MTADEHKAELEFRLLYSMVVAGKSADFAQQAMQRFLEGTRRPPFEVIRHLVLHRKLFTRIQEARTGNYTKLTRGFAEAAKADLNLWTCTTEDLEKIHGIGPKTSRFFLLWTRGDLARCAALDTHVLKWLRSIGCIAPIATPGSRKTYARLEKIFLAEADARGISPRALDARIWDYCSKGGHRDGLWPADLRRR